MFIIMKKISVLFSRHMKGSLKVPKCQKSHEWDSRMCCSGDFSRCSVWAEWGQWCNSVWAGLGGTLLWLWSVCRTLGELTSAPSGELVNKEVELDDWYCPFWINKVTGGKEWHSGDSFPWVLPMAASVALSCGDLAVGLAVGCPCPTCCSWL